MDDIAVSQLYFSTLMNSLYLYLRVGVNIQLEAPIHVSKFKIEMHHSYTRRAVLP